MVIGVLLGLISYAVMLLTNYVFNVNMTFFQALGLYVWVKLLLVPIKVEK